MVNSEASEQKKLLREEVRAARAKRLEGHHCEDQHDEHVVLFLADHGFRKIAAYVATDDELVGLPTHVISVNELDPLRDEGLQYYRRLVRAGVPAMGRVVAGTCHGGDLLLAHAMPDVFAASIRDVSGFAHSLA